MSGEQRTVVGKCQSTEQKPGSEWVRFLIEVPGNTYPLRVDTRDEDVIKAGKDVGAEVATWTINEVLSDKINPRNNKPYTNRYLEAVVAGGTVGTDSGATTSGGGGTTGTMTNADWDAKERRDYRSRAWGQTLGAFEHTIKAEDDPILIFEKLKPFQRKVYEDIVRELVEPEVEPSLVDDDIPF